ncbi:MutS-related protein [Mucilaginibacter auburnensis]|uniref:MutS-like protein n=1 Tax=Mucilaginibacter auburnensis TaxID=1457233 RepID=A0A2H9VUV7_9SPHI|nr:DNA mismatch repair protein MutS [Mucilaginibacter auburnensis]PJJ84572.1 MutS-like protein [Mucilaginibacter auburnensis]
MEDIINLYQKEASAAAQEAGRYKKLSDQYSLLRLVVFFLMAIAVYAGIVTNDFTVIAISFVILLLVFAWLVQRQSGYEQKRKYYTDLERVYNNELNFISNSANIYSNGAAYNNEKHFYTSDLDIFGPASLFNLVNRAATSLGNNKLAAWLSAPSDRANIIKRQQAVEEIARKGQWKPEMQTLLLFANGTDINRFQQLFSYLKTPLNIPGERMLSKYITVAPILLTAALIGSYFSPLAKLVALFLAAANLVIVSSKGSYIVKSSFIADKISEALAAYAVAFEKIEQENWSCTLTAELANRIISKQTSKHIAQLSQLIHKLGYNLVMLVNLVLNVFFLWALKQVIAIEKWKRDNYQDLEDAFDVIAEFEALYSLAGLRINYADWTVPEIAEGEGYTVTGKALAHPLIKKSGRVENDYELNDTHKIDIITGSNMAGKSTFLRTVGINAVLALSGAPVCAKSMRVSVITLVSYMRIKDSLNESTSTFKAELDRLQMLLAAVEHEPNVFFLIDEMLRGTNSVDKYLGSKAVIEQLIKKRGVGMVATHDLQIAQLEQKYPHYVRNYYFDIRISDGQMVFDYKLKPGECKTFNASLLLKQIGIDVDTTADGL